ncbi:DNA repair family protein [Aspergillus steynii IBT 23096]|uniref:DNA repair family protein n=1 Tax=Aspergillus steynii IBT 23096 TaxID=1392250 RepID=A0A2I2FU36_9EURO|nr:DNA repair family protein [Aspergillus steynii IBT 23096]PLB44142.1 DNA repair family protein [Aspergillus steynii IBT 23096]
MSKRIHAFFQPIPKKSKTEDVETEDITRTNHPTYPFPIADLPSHIANSLKDPAKPARSITNQPDLDLLYFQPLLSASVARDLFHFLRAELPFYRVQYTIRRGGIDTQINTPRFTTVFGVDETSQFHIPPTDSPQSGSLPPSSSLIDTQKQIPVPKTRYARPPRPIPPCLSALRHLVERVSGTTYNFCLVNYYASGNDSITYHSDDERFLGNDPTIASLSLGAKRDFLMKHKPPTSTSTTNVPPALESKPLKFPLASGDMIVMRGPTQAHWLHSIPKRKAEVGGAGQGRINITFRRAVVPGGTDNYYRYNVGDGGVYRWSDAKGEMELISDECKG